MQAEVSAFFSAISLEKLQRSSAMPGRVSLRGCLEVSLLLDDRRRSCQQRRERVHSAGVTGLHGWGPCGITSR
jgi:hypothetical protein